MRKSRTSRCTPDAIAAQRGISLIEALVTLVVVALGVLGMAALQAAALRAQTDATMRSGAVVVGLDLVERIEANNRGAIDGSYVAALPAVIPGLKDCRAVNCTAAEIAAFDLDQFQQAMAATLPNASATVVVGEGVVGTGPLLYTITITWTQRTAAARGATIAARAVGEDTGVDAGGQTETLQYTFSRRVYDKSAVL